MLIHVSKKGPKSPGINELDNENFKQNCLLEILKFLPAILQMMIYRYAL